MSLFVVNILLSVCRSTDSDPLITGSFGGLHLLGFFAGLSINSVSSSSAKGGNGVDDGDGGGDVVGDGGGDDVGVGDGVGVGDDVGDGGGDDVGGGVSASGLKSPSKGLFKSNSSIP